MTPGAADPARTRPTRREPGDPAARERSTWWVRGGLAFAAAIALLALSASRAGESRSYPPERSGAAAIVPAPPASHASPKTTSAAAASLSTDVETGRAILSHHCGTCHTPGLPTSKAGALAIFSLADTDWTARMTASQICASGRRIKGTTRNTPDEGRAYAEVVGRLLQKRGAPPCGS